MNKLFIFWVGLICFAFIAAGSAKAGPDNSKQIGVELKAIYENQLKEKSVATDKFFEGMIEDYTITYGEMRGLKKKTDSFLKEKTKLDRALSFYGLKTDVLLNSLYGSMIDTYFTPKTRDGEEVNNSKIEKAYDFFGDSSKENIRQKLASIYGHDFKIKKGYRFRDAVFYVLALIAAVCVFTFVGICAKKWPLTYATISFCVTFVFLLLIWELFLR